MRATLLILLLCSMFSFIQRQACSEIIGPLTQLSKSECCCVFFGNLAGRKSTSDIYVDAFANDVFYIIKINSTGVASVDTSSPQYLGKPQCTASKLWFLSEEITSRDAGGAQLVSRPYDLPDAKIETDFSVSILNYWAAENGSILLDYRGISRNLEAFSRSKGRDMLIDNNETLASDMSTSTDQEVNIWLKIDDHKWNLMNYNVDSQTSYSILEVNSQRTLYNPTFDAINQKAYFTFGNDIVVFNAKDKKITDVATVKGRILDMYINDNKLYYTVAKDICKSAYSLYVIDLKSKDHSDLLFKSSDSPSLNH